MKKIFVIGIIMLLVLTMVGCDDNTSTVVTTRAFLGGEMGLDAQFEKSLPPDEILDEGQQSFAIALKLENIGEADVLEGEGYVEIKGISPENFDKSSQEDLKKEFSDDLRKAKKSSDSNRIEGGISYIDFPDLKFLPDISGDQEISFQADVCYDYMTTSTALVCIKKEGRLDVDKGICNDNEEKEVQNSGSPIHITKLVQSPAGRGKTRFAFTISHVGDPLLDSFFKKDTNCDDEVSNSDRYKILFKVPTEINGKKFECTTLEGSDADESEGFITLYDKKERSVQCTLDVSNADASFPTSITVELEYRYLQRLDRTSVIKDVSD